MATQYDLTPEHRAQLEPWAQRWIAHAMRATPMTDADRAAMRTAVVGLYAAAGLPAPRVVFAPSPFVARLAAGFAAALWHRRGTDADIAATWAATEAATEAATWAATRDATGAATRAATEAATRAATWAATEAATEAATWDATRDATGDATEAATWAATWDATEAATEAATWAATRAATRAATGDATGDATEAATRAATRAATGDATGDATEAATEAAVRALAATSAEDEGDRWYVGMGARAIRALAAAMLGPDAEFGLACAREAYQLWDGGNQWPGYTSWLSFFRHVVGLPLDYSKWQHYEAAAIHGGPRLMHREFCIVSDFPVVLTVDEARRPHGADGPFCRWADGTALYAWHGTRVPWWVIEQPARITVARIQQEPNTEVRRAMIERRGWDWYLEASGAQPVQRDRFGALYRTTVDDVTVGVVVVDNSTPEPDGSIKRYALLVPAEHETAHAAVASTFGLTAAQYAPAQET